MSGVRQPVIDRDLSTIQVGDRVAIQTNDGRVVQPVVKLTPKLIHTERGWKFQRSTGIDFGCALGMLPNSRWFRKIEGVVREG